MLKLSPDGKALMGLIAEFRREMAKGDNTGYSMDVHPKTKAKPYRWSVQPYDGKMFLMMRNSIMVGIEGAQLYEPFTHGFHAILEIYEVPRLLLAEIAKNCIAANRGVNCYRAVDTFYLTDGLIQIQLEKIPAGEPRRFSH